MFLELYITWADFPVVLLLFIFLYVAVLILGELARRDQESEWVLQSFPAGTTNVTDIQGDGNISVNAGSFSTVTITCPQVVEKPLPRTARLNNRRQKLCRKMLDQLGRLSANGELQTCKRSIDRLIQATSDPDYRAALWNAAAINCINGGKMKSARKALRHVTGLLDQTENSVEHKLGRDHYLSLIYLRENKYDQGVCLTTGALQQTERLQPGCMSAWVLINHGWFYTKMAIQEQDHYDQAELIRKAIDSYMKAIDFSHQEFPSQLQDNKSRIHQFSLIGQVYLLLRCWRSVDGNYSKLGMTDQISQKDLAKAEEVLSSLEKGEPLCGICEVLYKIAKAHLYYRKKQYQEGLKEAKRAKVFAKERSFMQYHDFADSIVKHFERTV